MASVRDAIYYVLANDSAVAAIVSTRIYPNRAPQNPTYPYCVYSEVTGRHERHLGGGSGLADTQMQIVLVGRSTLTALFKAVREALDNLNHETIASHDVRGVFVVSEGDITATPREGSDIPVYTKRIDVRIWHEETVTP